MIDQDNTHSLNEHPVAARAPTIIYSLSLGANFYDQSWFIFKCDGTKANLHLES